MAAPALKPPWMSAWDEIRSTARQWQFDWYLAATLAPRAARRDLIVLAALAGDIERIVWTVNEPAMAAIRLQWWHDRLIDTQDGRSGHPLGDAVADVLKRHRLPVALLIGHIETQDIELYSDLVADLDHLWQHFEKRDGVLFNLNARVLGAGVDGPARETIGHAARAYGLARTLAQVRARRTRTRQLLLPADRALEYGIEPGALSVGDDQSLRHLIADLAPAARCSLEQCRAATRQWPAAAKAALLPLSICESYLQFASRQFDAALAAQRGPTSLTKAWKMLLAHWFGRM